MAETENINTTTLHYFEGVEKLLEIWFRPSNKNAADLRKIPRSMWEILLKSVRCEIISFSRNDNIDAYVLSESSMFVSKRRWILKTCGTTSPLQGLEQLLQMAEQIGYIEVEDLFYSRKNFKRPELQNSPHSGFDEEVAFLDSMFDDGRAYCFGSVNRDCWYLYTLCRGGGKAINKLHMDENNDLERYLQQNNHGNNNIFIDQLNGLIIKNGIIGGINKNGDNRVIGGGGGVIIRKGRLIDNNTKFIVDNAADIMKDYSEPDQTIEILMTELNPQIMSIFTKNECTKANEATEKSGINKLIPGMIIDDYLFNPCGYSMNGIGKNISGEYSQGCYMTIHITPESEFSYVSFESNLATSNYNDLINRVIDTFQPGKFIVTIFANKSSPAYSAFYDLNNAEKFGDSWQRDDIQYCRFKSYDLTYAQYCKFPS